jgi:hypothetical protein
MQGRPPSRTASGAAVHRAAHQTLEGGTIFADPLARTILGKEAGAIIEDAAGYPSQRTLRLFIAARSRFAEDCLSAAVSRGLRQAVFLGAGLDTFSLRNPHARRGLRVFEVNHPRRRPGRVSAWRKRERAAAAQTFPASSLSGTRPAEPHHSCCCCAATSATPRSTFITTVCSSALWPRPPKQPRRRSCPKPTGFRRGGRSDSWPGVNTAAAPMAVEGALQSNRSP